MHGNPQPPFYAGFQSYLTEHQITSFTPQTIRQAIIAIRTQKLPDPSQVANTGSFFENPIVDKGILAQLLPTYGNIPYWQTKTVTTSS